LIRDLKITTLADNLTMTTCFGQWGLSFLLELVDSRGDRRKIVFDTARDKNCLLHNVMRLNIKLGDVDCVVISHGHRDHTATTAEIVESAGGVKVYAHPRTFLHRFFEDKFGKRQSIGVPEGQGLDEIEKAGGQVLLQSKPTEIVPGVWTTGEIQRVTSFEQELPLSKGEKTIIVIDGKEADDHIVDDQALWMETDEAGPIAVTGCAHAGLINTLLHVRRTGGFKQVRGFVGGTHLIGRTEAYLQMTVEQLKQFGLNSVSPCHCTGFEAMARLWQDFHGSFVLNFAGKVMVIGEEQKGSAV